MDIRLKCGKGEATLWRGDIVVGEIYNWDRARWKGSCKVGDCKFRMNEGTRTTVAQMLSGHIRRQHPEPATELSDRTARLTAMQSGTFKAGE